LEQILYASSGDGRYSLTCGTLDSLDSIILDVAPQIRNILRIEHQAKRRKMENISLQNLWTNKRITRKRTRDEKEGKKAYFDDRIDAEAVLNTWLNIPRPENED
jgi:hypothetical protein